MIYFPGGGGTYERLYVIGRICAVINELISQLQKTVGLPIVVKYAGDGSDYRLGPIICYTGRRPAASTAHKAKHTTISVEPIRKDNEIERYPEEVHRQPTSRSSTAAVIKAENTENLDTTRFARKNLLRPKCNVGVLRISEQLRRRAH